MTHSSSTNKTSTQRAFGVMRRLHALGLCALVWLCIFGGSTAGAFDSRTRGLVPSSSVLHPVALVNCGGAAVTDSSTGFTWDANTGKTPNSVSVSTTAGINTTNTTNSPKIYQSARQFRRTATGPYTMEITIAVSNFTSSSYLVELHFAELQTARRRIFTVVVQGTVVENRFEILQAAGNAPFTAVTLATQVPSPPSGKVVIELIPVRYNPLISAIAVYEVVPAAPSLNPTKSPSPSVFPSHIPTKSSIPLFFPSHDPTKSPHPSSLPPYTSQTPTSSSSSTFWGSGSWIEVETNHSALERRHEACFVWLNGKGKQAAVPS